MLVTGPAIRRTSAAPGDIPAATRDAASGAEAVVQMYMGMEIASIISMPGSPCVHGMSLREFSGSRVLMRAARRIPISSQR